MGEAFKVVAVVKFNDSEALVLNRPIEFVYEEVGRDFVGTDGPFRDFLGYGRYGSMKAFAGRELTLTMKDGSVRKIKDNWWATWKQGYSDVTVKDLVGLQRCYVFNSAHITPDDYARLRGEYAGPVYSYWEYEKIIKYDSERTLWIGKCCDAEKKLSDRNKRDKLIANLLVGRSALLRAAEHVKDYWHIADLHCTLEDDYGHLPIVGKDTQDHIGKYKATGKEYGFDMCDDEFIEITECPLCSTVWAAYHARKIIKARIGRINGILTRMGNKMRGEK